MKTKIRVKESVRGDLTTYSIFVGKKSAGSVSGTSGSRELFGAVSGALFNHMSAEVRELRESQNAVIKKLTPKKEVP